MAKKDDIKTNQDVKRKEGGQPGNKNAEKWTEDLALELGNDLLKWLGLEGNIFYEEYLYLERDDLYLEIISYLSNKYESFLKLIKRAKKIQEMKLIKYGVSNKLQPAITIFVLKNHHNYTDKQDITTDGHSINNIDITNDQVREIVESLKPGNESEKDSTGTGSPE